MKLFILIILSFFMFACASTKSNQASFEDGSAIFEAHHRIDQYTPIFERE